MDFKIRASQRLLLKAAFSQNKQEGAAALSQWWGRVGDFHEVQGTDASIFPEIYGNLGAYISDPKLAARMRGVARHHWLKNKYLIRFCAELLNHLADAGIPVLLLKGVAIATAIDRDPGLRAMNDCDVLVPRSLAIRAVRILESTGLIEKAFVDARDLDIIHGVTLFHSGTGLDTSMCIGVRSVRSARRSSARRCSMPQGPYPSTIGNVSHLARSISCSSRLCMEWNGRPRQTTVGWSM